MIFGVISIFPEMFTALTNYGVTRRAFDRKICKLLTIDLREFALRGRVDDKSFGGGAGMVMKIEPLEKAITYAQKELLQLEVKQPLKVYLSPQGSKINQSMINKLAQEKGIIFVCGRYEGVDERFIERNIDQEISTGDFVVSGGEIPAMLVIDAIARQIPGVLNSRQSAVNDSFMHGLLDYPHYTLPRDYQGDTVPEELLSGDHKQIENWRLLMSLRQTFLKRPDLLQTLDKFESGLLEKLSRNKTKDKK